MKVRTLIATNDKEYVTRLSDCISDRHSGAVDAYICTDPALLKKALSEKSYDIGLFGHEMLSAGDIARIPLPMILWTDEHHSNIKTGYVPISKHQRISSLVSDMLQRYAKISKRTHNIVSRRTNVTAVWSPAGGVGKTTVALSYANHLASKQKSVFYLNLEPFSSVPAFFGNNEKSISLVFELLDAQEGDVGLFVEGIASCDDGIKYLAAPENFDDINILTPENLSELVSACSASADELVVDLSSVMDEKTKQIFRESDRIILVVEPSFLSDVKFSQFWSQCDMLDEIKEKIVLLVNKGCVDGLPAKIADNIKSSHEPIFFPLVEAQSESSIYKILSTSWQDSLPESQGEV